MKIFKEEDVEPQNPPKYELLKDMANMTFFSDAIVVQNLKSSLGHTTQYCGNNKVLRCTHNCEHEKKDIDITCCLIEVMNTEQFSLNYSRSI